MKTRAQEIHQLRARALRLKGKRKHMARAKVIARLTPLVTRQLKAEIRMDRKTT